MTKMAEKVIREYRGEVVSDKMEKTVVVKVVRTFTHPVFHKVLKTMKKYNVHDEESVAKLGDIVEFKECRPYSKTKHTLLTRVVVTKTV